MPGTEPAASARHCQIVLESARGFAQAGVTRFEQFTDHCFYAVRYRAHRRLVFGTQTAERTQTRGQFAFLAAEVLDPQCLELGLARSRRDFRAAFGLELLQRRDEILLVRHVPSKPLRPRGYGVSSAPFS